jgi:ubiquinone/menaquinone biosynthesis C-methylase UbiE
MDFDAIAPSYDRNVQRFRDIQGEIEEILSFLNLQPDNTILEMGTGTGEFALAAARRCARVYAIDISSGMLEYAQDKARSQGIDNVDFLPGGFLTYRHQNEPLDAFVSQIALHHLPDFWKQIALLNMAEMLRPGGKLCLRDIVYSFDPRDYERQIESFVASTEEKAGPGFAQRITSHINKEFSTMDWIMRGLIERAGFVIEREEHKEGFLGLYLCRKI